MAELDKLSEAEVLVECSTLSHRERSDLQAFLERQPEVLNVSRKLHLTDALLSPDALGLVAPRFDLIVHIAGEEAHMGTTANEGAALMLAKVAEWTEAHQIRGA